MVHCSARFARLGARHGWTTICDFLQPDRLPRGERNPRHEVPPCDVIGLNTDQQSERNPSLYRKVVAKEVAIIRAVSPHGFP